MKTALVTGGYGFLGGHVVENLERRGYDVTILDLQKPDPMYCFPHKAEYIKADIREGLPMECDFDVVFHCAGLLGTETLFDRVREAAEVNIIGTINVLDWALVSPGTVIIQPNLLGDWLNIYMISKHCAESIGLMYHKHYGSKYLSVRPSDVYGPRQRPDEKKAAPTFIECAERNLDIPIYGDGTSWVNYVYVEDVANFLVGCYEAEAHGEIIDFCRPGGDMGIGDFAEAVLRATGSQSVIGYTAMRAGQPGNIYQIPYSTRRASEITDMTALTGLEEGLKETVAWYRTSAMR